MEKILIVDDSGASLRITKSMLEDTYEVRTANSCAMALRYLETEVPDLILLDVQMPQKDGFETLGAIRAVPATEQTPVIFIAAALNVLDEEQALSMGAVDYIRKPFSKPILKSRIRNQLDLALYRNSLEAMVLDKARQLERTETALVASMNDLLDMRDGITGSHVRRVAAYFEILLEAMDTANVYESTINDAYKERLLRGAPLHDIGKIGIRDNTLLKPSRLSEEEMENMRQHSTYGGLALGHAIEIVGERTFLDDARDMAYYHHEKWDGSGYPTGLAGEEIPLSARMLAVVDVYDALTSKRTYKEAFSHEKAVEILIEGKNTSFDAAIVDVFVSVQERFQTKLQEFAEKGEA